MMITLKIYLVKGWEQWLRLVILATQGEIGGINVQRVSETLCHPTTWVWWYKPVSSVMHEAEIRGLWSWEKM
jgi:hypothetical protein